MCGIFGSVAPYLIDAKKSISLLNHRGPDHLNYLDTQSLGHFISLAHARLSIIDLSDVANQPLRREDLGLVIVFNGEIYNYATLREELLSQGCTFKTQSDTEVILVGYAHEGSSFLNKMRGMFAFAIYDQRRGNIFLARDRVGKKPLYFYRKDGVLLFSSEIKSLLTCEGVGRSLNLMALEEYLSLGYIPAPKTIYQEIQVLNPGHYLLHHIGGGTEIFRYWRVHYESAQKSLNHVEAITSLIDDSVKIRMLASDVPVGAFLSGGIDSSAVVAFASKYVEKLKTFSIKFQENSFDESRYAELVAKKFRTDHHQFTLDSDLVHLLPKIVWHFDQPFADSSSLPTFYLSQKTSEHVKVVLSGDGGDESFVGYERYLAHLIGEKFENLPGVARKILRLIANSITTTEPKHFLFKLRRMIHFLLEDGCYQRYLGTIQIFSPREILELTGRNIAAGTMKEILDRFSSVLANKSINKVIGFDFENYLPDDLLVKVDRASMAHSLEVRSPFLDHKLIEYMSALPMHIKLKHFHLKHLLKNKVLRGVLPDEVLFRKKMGFGVPIHQWFKKDIIALTEERLFDSSLGVIPLNQNYMEKILQEHKEEKQNHAYKLWSLLMLRMWEDQWGRK
ncbi:MAG: asparagine synthase (glutamine-hydrolyzing) [Oligoflexia bacterium]|nr:asparagine synthase (glutamine-hydrolyzing) [Oligoflexia bacterium]